MDKLLNASLLASFVASRLERGDAFHIAGATRLRDISIKAAFERFDELSAVMAEIKIAMESAK